MKHLLIAALFSFILVGCDKSNPVENSTTGDALYSEETMYKTTISSDDELGLMHGNGPGYDSLRHGRMLGHLKTYLELTDEQFDGVKQYAQTMFAALNDIRSQVHDSLITRDEAREKVVLVRAEFVASIASILTVDQSVKFEDWVTNFWNKPPRRPGHGGRGGHGGPGRP